MVSQSSGRPRQLREYSEAGINENPESTLILPMFYFPILLLVEYVYLGVGGRYGLHLRTLR
jgi:hypothetical protein